MYLATIFSWVEIASFLVASTPHDRIGALTELLVLRGSASQIELKFSTLRVLSEEIVRDQVRELDETVRSISEFVGDGDTNRKGLFFLQELT